MTEISKAALPRLADERLAEARALLEAGRPSGAYYLAGYAIEMRLKALIADKFSAGVIPDKKFVNEIHTHNIDNLAKLAGLDVRAEAQKSPAFSANWLLMQGWSEQRRYTLTNQDEATELLTAIGHPTDGVMAWLSRHS